MSGVGGDGEQSFRSSLKQDGIDLSWVLKCQATDLLWKSEGDVEVRNGVRQSRISRSAFLCWRDSTKFQRARKSC